MIQVKYSQMLFDYVVSESDTEEQEAFESELREALDAIDRLGEPCKTILQQFYFEGKSLTEICRHIGYKNVESVKVQKCKCLRRLRCVQRREDETVRR
jgi:DNA-directed RNA polymerase specialized sigma24 family protein